MFVGERDTEREREREHFPNHLSMHIFLTSEIGPDILMKVFEGYIILLISAGWLLFSFYLKQKQRFSAWSFTEITSFISFHEGNLSITKNNKKCRFQLINFKCNKNKKQKLKQNLLTQLCWIHCNIFFQQKSSFPKS